MDEDIKKKPDTVIKAPLNESFSAKIQFMLLYSDTY